MSCTKYRRCNLSTALSRAAVCRLQPGALPAGSSGLADALQQRGGARRERLRQAAGREGAAVADLALLDGGRQRVDGG